MPSVFIVHPSVYSFVRSFDRVLGTTPLQVQRLLGRPTPLDPQSRGYRTRWLLHLPRERQPRLLLEIVFPQHVPLAFARYRQPPPPPPSALSGPIKQTVLHPVGGPRITVGPIRSAVF